MKIQAGQIWRRPSTFDKGETQVDHLILGNRGRTTLDDYREDTWESIVVASHGPYSHWHSPGGIVAATESNWLLRSVLVVDVE